MIMLVNKPARYDIYYGPVYDNLLALFSSAVTHSDTAEGVNTCSRLCVAGKSTRQIKRSVQLIGVVG